MEKKLLITQTKSMIHTLKKHKATIIALGLGRPNFTVIKKDTPQIRGMINRVNYLVRVEEVKE
ncbi:MAG: 50S ribosomal protein L30 [Bacteroidetes bacterium]|nr:50S ribosomal protein L30 [Bacteroidota bacterium]